VFEFLNAEREIACPASLLETALKYPVFKVKEISREYLFKRTEDIQPSLALLTR